MFGDILQVLATWSIAAKCHGSTIAQDLRDLLEEL